MSNLTEFTSYWGNALQGIWIKYAISALGTDGTISTDTKMTMTFDVRMYATGYAGIETANDLITNTPDATKWKTPAFNTQANVVFYMLFRNPMDVTEWNAITAGSRNEPHNDFIAYDGLLTTLKVDYTGSTSSLDTLLVLKDPGTGIFTDIYCPANLTNGAYDHSTCVADTTSSGSKTTGLNDYTVSGSTTNFCTEQWQIAAKSLRCVRAGFTAERKM